MPGEGGHQFHIGFFMTEEEAAEAVDQALYKKYGLESRFNFPHDIPGYEPLPPKPFVDYLNINKDRGGSS